MKYFKLTLTLIFVFFSVHLWSAHILGGHIGVECIGADQYEVTLEIYVDCFGSTPAVPSVQLDFTAVNGCAGVSDFNIDTPLISDVEISELCASELPGSSCNGGFTPGTRLLTYTTVQTLDPACVWNIGWAETDYNNFANADLFNQEDAYINTTINATQGCNSTVDIDATQQLPFIDVGVPFNHQIEFTNTSGNDINFSISTPQVLVGGTAVPLAGYNDAGMTVSTGGLISFTPPTAGNYVISVDIDEVDAMGNILSTITETFAFISRISIQGDPEFTNDGAIINEGGTAFSATDFEACIGDSICLTFEAVHPDPFRSMSITSDVEVLFPGAVLDSIECPIVDPTINAICSRVCWSVQDNAGVNEFTLTVTDDDCEDPGIDEVTIILNVTDGSSVELLSNEETICEGDLIDLSVTASGSGDLALQYSVETIGSNLPDTLIIEPFDGSLIPINPTDSVEVCLVSLNDSEGCVAEIDPINQCYNINVNPELTTTGFGVDTTLCQGASLDFDLGLTGTAPYTVSYTTTEVESGVVSAQQQISLGQDELWQVTPSLSTLYTVTNITDSAPVTPCSITTPFDITVQVNEFTDIELLCDSIACSGDQVLIDFFLTNFEGPQFDITYTTQEGVGPEITTTLTDISVDEFTPDSLYTVVGTNNITQATTFTITELIDEGNICTQILGAGGTSVLVAPDVSADFNGGGTACFGDSIPGTINFTGDGDWIIEIDVPDDTDNEVITVEDNPFTYQCDQEGIYELVQVTDVYGCSAMGTGTVELTELDLPTGNIDGTTNICPDGTVDIPFTLNGVAPFTVEILDPSLNTLTVNAGNMPGDTVFTATEPGIYTLLTITSSENCLNDTTTSTHEVIEVTLPEVSLSGNDFLCDQDSTHIFIDVINGEGPFTYELIETNSGALISFNEVEAEDSVFVFTSGDYTIQNFVDSNFCAPQVINTLTINDRLLPLADAGGNQTSCANSEVVIGGLEDPGLDYSWSSNILEILENSTEANPEITLINTGTVEIIWEGYLEVFDGFCFGLDTVEVLIPPQPFSDAGADQIICYNEPVVLNGSGDGTLSWVDNGNLDDFNIATPNVLNTQQTDTFILQIEDLMNPGCFGLDSVIVQVNPEIVFDIVFSQNLCFEQCDGEISYSVSGGSPMYTEEWTNSNGDILDNLLLTDLCADDYTLSVSDDVACTLDSTITITELEEYFISEVVSVNPICFGDETGSLSISALNAEEFYVNALPMQMLGDYTNLAAGDYAISVISDIGCEADTTVTLTSNPELILTTNFSTTDICVGDMITFQATAAGGVGDYSFVWLPGDGDFNTTANSVTTAPLEDVEVQVYFTDDAGQCLSDTLTMSALFPPDISVQVNEETTICQGESVLLQSEPDGGTGVLSCTWDVPESGMINNCVTEVFPNVTTTYEVLVEDGCSVPLTAEVIVNVLVTPVPEFSLDVSNGCLPLTVNLQNTTLEEQQGSCTWDFDDGSDPLVACNDIEYTYVSEGNYFPTLTVTSDNGCSAVSQLATEVSVYGFPEVDFEWTPDPVTILEPEVQFINLTTGASNYSWEAEGAFTANSANPFFEFEPNSLDFYEICLAAENQFGCADTLCKFLLIEGIVIVNVPSAFTPDSDGRNEVFMPVAVGIAEQNYKFQVWSREGRLVFETTERGVPWDGSNGLGDYYVQNDVYTWVLEVQDSMTAEIETFKGHVTVLR